MARDLGIAEALCINGAKHVPKPALGPFLAVGTRRPGKKNGSVRATREKMASLPQQSLSRLFEAPGRPRVSVEQREMEQTARPRRKTPVGIRGARAWS